VREWRHVHRVVGIDENARVRGVEPVAAVPTGVGFEQAGDRLLLEPFPRVAGRDSGALDELAWGKRVVPCERAVQAELGPEVTENSSSAPSVAPKSRSASTSARSETGTAIDMSKGSRPRLPSGMGNAA
jgi:hypothetical protein